MSNTLKIEELAERMGIAVQTLRNRLSARPDTIPPPVMIPGHGRVFWMRDTVDEWFKARERRPA